MSTTSHPRTEPLQRKGVGPGSGHQKAALTADLCPMKLQIASRIAPRTILFFFFSLRLIGEVFFWFQHCRKLLYLVEVQRRSTPLALTDDKCCKTRSIQAAQSALGDRWQVCNTKLFKQRGLHFGPNEGEVLQAPKHRCMLPAFLITA